MLKHAVVLLSLTAPSLAVYAVEADQPALPCPITVEAIQQRFDPKLFGGKVMLVDFWATWCPPCLKSIPFFNTLYNEIPHDTFQIIAVNLDEDKHAVDDYLLEHPVTYPIAFDPNGDCPEIYAVKAMPSSYLIDKNGIVRTIHLGYRDGDQQRIKDDIDKLLAE